VAINQLAQSGEAPESVDMTKTVLAVDDSKIMRDLLSFSLKQAGYNVLQAENGEEATRMLDTHEADCIVTDINMPVMDGIELVKTLRATGTHKEVPILLLATDSEELKRQTGRHAGANGWVPKPFNPAQLVETVRKVCV